MDVLTGDGAMLDRMLSSGRHRSALVHFLNPRIWEVVARHIDRIPVTVWVHGSEIQPWWRRQHDVGTEADLRAAKLRSDRRLAFWRDLLDPMPPNLKLVFVSQHFADEVMEDLDIVLPRERYEIIHNPIDTELFSYAEKPVEQRAKVLSVRPYSSVIYGNDLAVKAIELLSGEPGFKDMAFRMVGDGPLFEETLGPLRRFPNVTLEQRFLAQSEIAALHKAHGVCLIPTRADTQGVSRDEAMASGLVPVTNAVAAVPEFVDESCGILRSGGRRRGARARHSRAAGRSGAVPAAVQGRVGAGARRPRRAGNHRSRDRGFHPSRLTRPPTPSLAGWSSSGFGSAASGRAEGQRRRRRSPRRR